MEQALELFELLQSRRSAEAVRPLTVDAQQVELVQRRDEPLSFMTLRTVEEIIDSTDIDAMGRQDGKVYQLGTCLLFGQYNDRENVLHG